MINKLFLFSVQPWNLIMFFVDDRFLFFQRIWFRRDPRGVVLAEIRGLECLNPPSGFKLL